MIFTRDLRLVAGLAFALAALGGCDEAAPNRSPVEEARVQLARGDALAAQVQLEQALAADAMGPLPPEALGKLEPLYATNFGLAS